jgi:hypothetical protein
MEPPTANGKVCNALDPRIEATACRKEPSLAFASGGGTLVPRCEAALACGKDQRAEARMEPDGAGGQVVARQHGQPAPGWSAQEEMSAWDFLHAELVAGLEHCEVGLGP